MRHTTTWAAPRSYMQQSCLHRFHSQTALGHSQIISELDNSDEVLLTMPLDLLKKRLFPLFPKLVHF